MTVCESEQNDAITGPLDLPEEILAMIFSYLDNRNLKNLKLVHSKFRDVVDNWCKLTLKLNFCVLDSSRPPISNFNFKGERFDRVTFCNVRFGENYQRFLKEICSRTEKIAIITNAYLLIDTFRFDNMREILLSCPKLKELDLKVHVLNIASWHDEKLLRKALQNITRLNLRGKIRIQGCTSPIARVFQWLSQGRISHLMWSKFLPDEKEDSEQVEREILRFLQGRQNDLKCFYVDQVWSYVREEFYLKVFDALSRCSQLEQVNVKCLNWTKAIEFAKDKPHLSHLRVDIVDSNEYYELFVQVLAEKTPNLKSLWVVCKKDHLRRYFDAEKLQYLRHQKRAD